MNQYVDNYLRLYCNISEHSISSCGVSSCCCPYDDLRREKTRSTCDRAQELGAGAGCHDRSDRQSVREINVFVGVAGHVLLNFCYYCGIIYAKFKLLAIMLKIMLAKLS